MRFPQSNVCSLLPSGDRKSPWLVGNSIYPCITTLSFKILLPTVLPRLQTSWPSALVSHSAMSHHQSWDHILEVLESFTQAPTAPTSLAMPSPSHSPREETPKIATMTFRLTENQGKATALHASFNFPKYSSAQQCIAALKDGHHYTMHCKKTTFQSKSGLVLRNPQQT